MHHVAVICKPGSALGPCRGNCPHARCHAAKRLAAAVCPYCLDTVGYYAGYAEYPGNRDGKRRRYCHSVCLERAIKEGSAKAMQNMALVCESVAGRLPEGSAEAEELLHAVMEAERILTNSGE